MIRQQKQSTKTKNAMDDDNEFTKERNEIGLAVDMNLRLEHTWNHNHHSLDSCFEDVSKEMLQNGFSPRYTFTSLLNQTNIDKRMGNEAIYILKHRLDHSLEIKFDSEKFLYTSTLVTIPKAMLSSVTSIKLRTRECDAIEYAGCPEFVTGFTHQFKELNRLEVFHNEVSCAELSHCKLVNKADLIEYCQKVFNENHSLEYMVYKYLQIGNDKAPKSSRSTIKRCSDDRRAICVRFSKGVRKL